VAPLFLSRCAAAQYHQTICKCTQRDAALNSHRRHKRSTLNSIQHMLMLQAQCSCSSNFTVRNCHMPNTLKTMRFYHRTITTSIKNNYLLNSLLQARVANRPHFEARTRPESDIYFLSLKANFTE